MQPLGFSPQCVFKTNSAFQPQPKGKKPQQKQPEGQKKQVIYDEDELKLLKAQNLKAKCFEYKNCVANSLLKASLLCKQESLLQLHSSLLPVVQELSKQELMFREPINKILTVVIEDKCTFKQFGLALKKVLIKMASDEEIT